MTDIALPTTATTRGYAPLAATALVTGVVNVGLAVTQLLAPAQPSEGRFLRTTDYLIEYQFAASLLLAAVAVVLLSAAHRRVGVRWGRFGPLAAAGYALGTTLFGISAIATAVNGVESLDVVQFPAILVWLVAGLLMAIATVRARLLPLLVGIGFALALPATMAIGHAGPLVIAALWIAVAASMRTR